MASGVRTFPVIKENTLELIYLQSIIKMDKVFCFFCQ